MKGTCIFKFNLILLSLIFNSLHLQVQIKINKDIPLILDPNFEYVLIDFGYDNSFIQYATIIGIGK